MNVLRAVLLAIIVLGQASAARAERVRFDIPTGRPTTTPRNFADQSNMNVLFQSDEATR